MADAIVHSLGYGVLHVKASDEPAARDAAGQIGPVREIWLSPGSEGVYVAVVDGAHDTGPWESKIADDGERADDVRFAAEASDPGSLLRARLVMVVEACKRYGSGPPKLLP